MDCIFCNNTYTTKGNYKRHLIQFHLQNFEDTSEIIRELGRISNKNIKPFECEQCGKNFTTEHYLQKHQNTVCGSLGRLNKFKSLIAQGIFNDQQISELKNLIDNEDKKRFKPKKKLEISLKEDYLVNKKEINNNLNIVDDNPTIINDNHVMNVDNHIDNSVDNHDNLTIVNDNHIDNHIDNQVVTNNVNNDNKTIYNNQKLNVNINVVNVGQEDINMLSHEKFVNDIVDLLEENVSQRTIGSKKFIDYDGDSLRQAILKTFKEIHCNQKYPENHNIYASNKNPYNGFAVHVDGEWQVTRDINVIRKIVMNTKESLVHCLDETKQMNPDERSQKTLESEINGLNLNYETEKGIKKSLCHDILMTAYSNKEIIKPTYKKSSQKKPKKQRIWLRTRETLEREAAEASAAKNKKLI